MFLEGGGGGVDRACVFVRGRQVRGTCAASFAPRKRLMGSPGLLENWPLCPNGCQPRGIDGAQLSPIIATAGLSKKEERGGVELSLQWGVKGHCCWQELERNGGNVWKCGGLF